MSTDAAVERWYGGSEPPQSAHETESATESAARTAMKFDAFRDVPPEDIVRLPQSGFQSVADFRPVAERMGAPSDPAGYEFDKLEGVDPKFAAIAAEWAFDNALTKAQAHRLLADQLEFERIQTQQTAESEHREAMREYDGLQAEWGAGWRGNVELGRRALREAQAATGLSGDEVNEVVSLFEAFLGPAKTIKLFSHLGRPLAEGDFIDGDTTPQPVKKSLAERLYPNDRS